jgi:hypothetical protein
MTRQYLSVPTTSVFPERFFIRVGLEAPKIILEEMNKEPDCLTLITVTNGVLVLSGMRL